MNVVIEDRDQTPFRIEVGYFDTVLDIKTRINKHQGVPIDHQILTFNDKVLDDNDNVESCFITHNVHIELHIVKPDSNTALLLFKLRDPGSTYRLFQVMDISDSVLQCKHKLPKKTCTTNEEILVDPTDKVQVLRRALVELEKSRKLELPRGGYYFINKGHGMIDESRSFLENNVCHYDQIEIFDGTFTQ
ncbi:hypothetical protein Cgig2_019540 [Carnegiea gigantea]|uniref:Ubiquitin-like domain-containing protein n=1 Tax=Carnegiea gigantea TaxID=171969 RepID=A0A9Q1KHR2_9CARY|nr:hypothetical protein Cgig2_019540 [Carnegiea gigantea]